LNILFENSNVIPEFKLFITYQGFCRKVRYLINLIENAPAIKRNLLNCLDEIDKDVACPTIYQKYEKLVDRLYVILWGIYNQVNALDDGEFPNKWDNFRELLLIMNYLNSPENPFARQNPAQRDTYRPFHQEALNYFAVFQNALADDTHVTQLTDDSLRIFYTQERSVLAVKISEMLQGGGDIAQIMSALSLVPSDSLLLRYLEGQPKPAAPKGALSAAVAKHGTFPVPGKKAGAAVTGRELVPAAAASSALVVRSGSIEDEKKCCTM
jgi:hypothetical protein